MTRRGLSAGRGETDGKQDQGNTAEGRSAGEGSRDPGCPAAPAHLSDAAVTKMIKQAKKRGYVTTEQLNAVMPSEEVTSSRSRTFWRCSTRWAST